MLDIKRIRTNKEEIIESLNSRFGNYNIDKVLELDEKRREIIFEVENKKARQNEVSKQVPKLKNLMLKLKTWTKKSEKNF